MLGTPNQGAHSMVEALIGKSDTLRSLARVDFQHDLQAILNIIGEFRGALQLLPKTGFRDVGATPFDEYYSVTRWSALKAEMKDFWFGDRVAAVPSEAALNQGKWLWDRDGLATPALPERHAEKTIYVHEHSGTQLRQLLHKVSVDRNCRRVGCHSARSKADRRRPRSAR